MGFIKNILKKSKKRQAIANFAAQSDEELAEREAREKQKLADDIRAHAKLQASQLLKIVNDCAELVNTTVNPEVFFQRYSLMLEHLEALAGLECTGIFANSAELPSEAFLRIEAQFGAATNDFLDRSFEATKKHADSLKTDKGKIAAIKRYFDNMEHYIIYMSGESLEYFDKLKELSS